MEFNGMRVSSEEEMELRKGPWTVEEDLLLMNYIANHGEGRWNSLARCAGLKRTGKSCRLRWHNYLRPGVRRGNITPQELLLILELHSRWGNRWSKIAQYLPGRTDNEIKNYWRTRVQKHAKQLRCDVNSKQFKDVIRYLWMPRLVERIQATTAMNQDVVAARLACQWPEEGNAELGEAKTGGAENSNTVRSSPESSEVQVSSSDCFASSVQGGEDASGVWFQETLPSAGVCDGLDSSLDWEHGWEENLWSMEDLWLQIEDKRQGIDLEL